MGRKIEAYKLEPKLFFTMLLCILIIFFTFIVLTYKEEAVSRKVSKNESFSINVSLNKTEENISTAEIPSENKSEEKTLYVKAEFLESRTGRENFSVAYDGSVLEVRSNPLGMGDWAVVFTVNDEIKNFSFEYLENASIQLFDPFIRIHFYSYNPELSANDLSSLPSPDYFYLAEARVDPSASYPVGQREMWGPEICYSKYKYCDSEQKGRKGQIVLSSEYLKSLAKEFKKKDIEPKMKAPVTVVIHGNNLVRKSSHVWRIREIKVNGIKLKFSLLVDKYRNRTVYMKNVEG
ncbi:hypothetical protein DRN74_00085 [Candidatus Micrarchaeota archaeon]|nr:MAG: hypothetical protein DRN74_00085 [Candidatus Micrarchaeota archaeon]